jgi:hypothetical protein
MITLLPGATSWRSDSAAFTSESFAQIGDAAFLLWSSRGYEGQKYLGRIQIHSEYEPLPFHLRGGFGLYSFNTNGLGWVFKSLGLYIPEKTGEHRVIVHDPSGATLQTPAIRVQ